MDFNKVEEVSIINSHLERIHHRHPVKNLPNFRLVWANDQLETRNGTFTITTDAGIFLREESGIKQVKKYPFYEDLWVIERLIPNPHQDVIGEDYVYEPIYTFKIFPIWRAVEFLLRALFNPEFRKQTPKTQKEADYQDNEKKKKESAYIRNLIDTTSAEIALHSGEAVSLSNKDGLDYRPSKQKVSDE